MGRVGEPGAAPLSQTPAERVDLFISYSRRDGEFVRRLHDALTERGKDVWVDWEDIPATAVWRDRVAEGIESADAFVFVLSPDSIGSSECDKELDRALGANKRIVPIVYRKVDPSKTRSELAQLNWLSFRDGDDFGASLDRLTDTLETDIGWLDAHTRLLKRAREWEGGSRDRSFLLRGSDLSTAEQWLQTQGGHAETATPLQIHYILASRQASSRRQRITLGSVAIALIVSLGLSILALVLRQQAVSREHTARSRELAARATSLLGSNPARSLAFATDAVGASKTDEAVASLRSALMASRLQSVLRPPAGHVVAAAISPDGRRVAADSARSAYVWDAVTGRLLMTLRHPPHPTSVVFSPDGTRIVTGGRDGTARVWDSSTGRLRTTLVAGAPVRSVSYDAHGDLVLTVTRKSASVWRASSGKLLHRWSKRLSGAGLSASGARVVGRNEDRCTVTVWDVRSGREVGSWRACRELLWNAVISPDGRLVATASSDGSFGPERGRIWNAATGKKLTELVGHTSTIGTVRFDPAGDRVLTSSDDATARLWAVRGGPSIELIGNARLLYDAEFSPNGALAVTASDDDSARVFEAMGRRSQSNAQRQLFTLYGHDAPVRRAVFSLDGSRILTVGDDGSARVWRVDLVELRTGGSFGTSVAFGGRGATVMTAQDNGVVSLWRTRDGKRLRRTLLAGVSGLFGVVALTPSTRDVVYASTDGGIVYELDGRTLEQLSDQDLGSNLQFAPVVAPSGGLALTVYANSRVAVVRELRTGASIAGLRGHTRPITAAAFSADGHLVATAGEDRTVRVWDPRTGEQMAALTERSAVNDVALSPDGRLVADSTDRRASVWDWRQERRIAILSGHTQTVKDVVFSADGRFVATSSIDATVRIWDATDGSLVTVLAGHAFPVNAAAFSPDSSHVATASNDNFSFVFACPACRPAADLVKFARSRLPHGVG